LRLAPKCAAFSTKTHSIYRQNALLFAANSPETGANGGLFKYKFILPHAHANPILHQNKPSRSTLFCGKVGD